MDDLGKRLANLRSKHKLTMQQVAKQIGIAPSTYSGYETGYREPDAETLAKLALLFDTTVDYLITGNTRQPHNEFVPPEERNFIEWVKENVDDAFFYNFDADPDEAKRQMMQDLKYLYERDKKKNVKGK